MNLPVNWPHWVQYLNIFWLKSVTFIFRSLVIVTAWATSLVNCRVRFFLNWLHFFFVDCMATCKLPSGWESLTLTNWVFIKIIRILSGFLSNVFDFVLKFLSTFSQFLRFIFTSWWVEVIICVVFTDFLRYLVLRNLVVVVFIGSLFRLLANLRLWLACWVIRLTVLASIFFFNRLLYHISTATHFINVIESDARCSSVFNILLKLNVLLALWLIVGADLRSRWLQPLTFFDLLLRCFISLSNLFINVEFQSLLEHIVS